MIIIHATQKVELIFNFFPQILNTSSTEAEVTFPGAFSGLGMDSVETTTRWCKRREAKLEILEKAREMQKTLPMTAWEEATRRAFRIGNAAAKDDDG